MAGQSKKKKLVTETFLLEPILTPSGIVDYADESTTVSLLASEHLAENFANQSSDSFETTELEQSWQVGEAEPLLDGISEPLADPDVPTSDSLASEQLQELSFIELSSEVNDNLDLDTSDATAGDDPEEVSVLPLSPPREVNANNNLETDSDNLSTNDVNNGPEVEISEATSESNSEEALSSQINSSSELTPSEIIVVDDATIAVDNFPSLDPSPDLTSPSYTFDSGVFTVGESGQVGIDFLFDGGKYQGEVAIFSLDGMGGFEPGSTEFIQEAARRALSNSELGHVIISDGVEGARFSAELGEQNWNSGDYLGVKSFTMNPGDEFAVMLVPNGSIEHLLTNPTAGGSRTPLFSLGTANPTDSFHLGQIVDVTGEGNTFVMEDFRMDKGSDRDYNDLIFQVRGATGKAASIDEYIAPAKDWRTSDMGQALIEYTKPYIKPEPVEMSLPDGLEGESHEEFEHFHPPAESTEQISYFSDSEPILTSPLEAQPLVGTIDTGVSANNPYVNYEQITIGRDWIGNDTDSTLQAGETGEHGTHVLGIIHGINGEAPLWTGRAVGSGDWATSLTEFVDQAIASNQPNAIINLSFEPVVENIDGSIVPRDGLTAEEIAALEYARQRNILILASAGNDNGTLSALAKATQTFDNILAVGSATEVDPTLSDARGFERASYSNIGNGLGIVANGGTFDNQVVSTVGTGLGTTYGTSVATAKVTGAASLVWAANPDLSYRQVIEILQSTATDLLSPNWDAETGLGLINVAAAVHLAKATTATAHVAAPISPLEPWVGEGRPLERSTSVPVWPTVFPSNFTGSVMATLGANVRSGPNTSSAIVDAKPFGTVLEFDGWTYGEQIVDVQLGTPDQRWYRIKGTNSFIASALISGNAPGSTPLPPSNPNSPTDSALVTINGFTVSGEFYSVWQNKQGVLNNPTSNVIAHVSGARYQLFQGGSIVSSAFGTFPLYGGIRQTYLNTGGLNGWLGAPKIAEYGLGSNIIRQDFANGYIEWNGSRAYAYRYGSGRPITANPDPTPINEPPLHPNPTESNPLIGFSHPLRGAGSITQEPGGSTSHTGRSLYAVDYGVSIGTPVYAMRSGRIVNILQSFPDIGGGRESINWANLVVVEHDGGYRSAYLHLQQGFAGKVGIRVGDYVKAGQLIGYSGNSGWSTGPHLHVEVHKPNNGYFGQTYPFKIS